MNLKEVLFKGYKMPRFKNQKGPVILKIVIKEIDINNPKIKNNSLNLMANILHKEKIGSITNFLLDDGTDKIILRSFEENKKIKNLNVGDSIITISSLREYNNQIYLSPDIIKKISPLWLKVRSLELKDIINFKEEIKEKYEIKDLEDTFSPNLKLINLVKSLDQGEGVLIEEIIEKSPFEDIEYLIQKMLEKGDLFKNQPGRVKVL